MNELIYIISMDVCISIISIGAMLGIIYILTYKG
jgi:hypothetical protein